MTARKPLLIAVAAALLACAAFWYLALAPRQERMSALDVEIATERAAVQQAQDQLAGHEAARRSYPATYERMVRLGKALPVEDDVRSLLVQLDRAAEASRVNFRTLGVGGQGGGAPAAATPAAGAPSAPVIPGTTPLSTPGLSAMPFSFTFAGEFFDLQRFLARVERFVTVRNARMAVTGRLLLLSTLSLKPDERGYPVLRAEIGATSYLSTPLDVLATSPAPPAGTAAPAPATPATPAPPAPAAPATPAPPAPAPPTTTASIR